MNVKIDTKEKFHVITLQDSNLSVNMTEELVSMLLSCLEKSPGNLILNLRNVEVLDDTIAEMLVQTQQIFYDKNASFVICELREAVENWLDQKELLEIMNVTPTESEAWDIVQMEEIERELLGDE